MDGVASFAVIVCMVVTVTALQDIVTLDVQMTDGVLAVYSVIAFHELCAKSRANDTAKLFEVCSMS